MLTNWAQIKEQLLRSNFKLPATAQMVQDSRKLKPGDIFVALVGYLTDGARFIDKALHSGASLILVSSNCDEIHYQNRGAQGAPLLVIDDLESNLPSIAREFYEFEQNKMPIIGITGTNGKTSISHFLAQLSELANSQHLAVIGTMGTGRIDNLEPAENTTPGVTEVYQLIQKFSRDSKTNYSGVAMEVSSHALHQSRVKGISFDVGIFTNLTLDHLDYHGSMEQYFAAKAKLFIEYSTKRAVINIDDEFGQRLLDMLPEYALAVAVGRSKQVKAYSDYVHIVETECHAQGIILSLDWQIGGHRDYIELQLPIFGEFNGFNIAAVFATAMLLGWSVQATHFSFLKSVPGRLEMYVQPKQPIAVVDYAHTPDALEQSIQSLRQHCSGKLYTIFGCGGDRDRSKRRVMAEIAERLSDHVIVTNDNPRTEPKERIVADILTGFTGQHEVIYDRKEAIVDTLLRANVEDTILIAGKGHETYQIIGTVSHDYDERAFTNQMLQALAEGKDIRLELDKIKAGL